MRSLLVASAMWMVMMVVMMLPAVLPWLTGFAALARDRETGVVRREWVVLFGAGYFAVWGAFSLGGASLQLVLREWGALGISRLGAPAALSAEWAGLVLVAAGLYQVTPLKSSCLEHCRTPMSFFLSRWRNGPVGAFRMGATHGAFCVGCCWALMLTGFALGLMNLVWMAALTLVIALETWAPHGVRIGRLAGAALVLWGLAVLTGV